MKACENPVGLYFIQRHLNTSHMKTETMVCVPAIRLEFEVALKTIRRLFWAEGGYMVRLLERQQKD